MPCKHRIDKESRLLITTWEGDAIDDNLIESLKNYQQTILSDNDYSSFNEIADFRKVKEIKLTTGGLVNLGQIASLTDNENSGKLAFIVNSKLAFGLARMYGIHRSNNPVSNKEIRVFENRNDAFEWVKQ
ncbi:MAG: hypothetical protein OQL16_02010 [Gammaproteobacteria bacterium]|nr:hypothetical protein [Gammaproteobacteria bacterium]